MKLKEKIICSDLYEAKKLGSLIFNKDGKEMFVTGILDVVENEIILSLKDKSAHSVLLKNEEQAEKFADFIQSIIEKHHELNSAKIIDNVVEITKSEKLH